MSIIYIYVYNCLYHSRQSLHIRNLATPPCAYRLDSLVFAQAKKTNQREGAPLRQGPPTVFFSSSPVTWLTSTRGQSSSWGRFAKTKCTSKIMCNSCMFAPLFSFQALPVMGKEFTSSQVLGKGNPGCCSPVFTPKPWVSCRSFQQNWDMNL